MNPSIHNIGDAASAALVEAGKVSIEIAERYCVLVEDGGGEEAVIYALNERGELGIDDAATSAVRQARKVPVAIRENLKLERPEDVVNHEPAIHTWIFSYTMNVMACPGAIRKRRGVSPL